SVMPIASMPRGSAANAGSTRACCSSLSAFCMICAIFRVCANMTETPMSPIPSSSITMEVVRESVPRPPHFLVERHGADADRVGPLDDLPGKALLGVYLRIQLCRPWLHFLLDEAPDGLKNELLVLVIDENIVHGPVLRACRDRRRMGHQGLAGPD